MCFCAQVAILGHCSPHFKVDLDDIRFLFLAGEEIAREEQKEQLDFDAKTRDTTKMGVRKANMLCFLCCWLQKKLS